MYVRIAQIAPLQLVVPPHDYGGTERVVAALIDALVALGHHVTLFARGDSATRAQRLIAPIPTRSPSTLRATRSLQRRCRLS
jgi:hypothetical protein